MTEEAFLRYRMEVVQQMPDSPSKKALLFAIESKMAALKAPAPPSRVPEPPPARSR